MSSKDMPPESRLRAAIDEEDSKAAARRIQKRVRRWLRRRRLKALLRRIKDQERYVKEHAKLSNRLATKRRELAMMSKLLQEPSGARQVWAYHERIEWEAARKIQDWWRGRVSIAKAKLMARDRRRELAARRIQEGWRILRSRLRLETQPISVLCRGLENYRREAIETNGEVDERFVQEFEEMIGSRLAAGVDPADGEELERLRARSWQAYITFLQQLPRSRRKEKRSFVEIETCRDLLHQFDRLLNSDPAEYFPQRVRGLLDAGVWQEARRHYEQEKTRILRHGDKGDDKAELLVDGAFAVDEDRAMGR
ncbi:hypothetical protein FOZ63_034361 [Perkinsus olseni]|uniref:Uncharacterized protein n=1 Tax=Perkinsus olseni TaxID=32597 RepID=A0A7J6P1K7_PEROL|nr:hypothetical protein FOZ63_034361 [Perkinsus olseni]